MSVKTITVASATATATATFYRDILPNRRQAAKKLDGQAGSWESALGIVMELAEQNLSQVR